MTEAVILTFLILLFSFYHIFGPVFVFRRGMSNAIVILCYICRRLKHLNIKASRLRSLCVEIYKNINSLNTSFMKETFRLRVTIRVVRSQYRLNFDIPKVNQVSFGNKSIRSFGPKIWNSLPPHIKSCENLETFKRVIKSWDGVTYNCRVCKN